MNTLAHLMAVVASLWLAIFCFDRLGEPALGVVSLAQMAIFLSLLIDAAMADFRALRRK